MHKPHKNYLQLIFITVILYITPTTMWAENISTQPAITNGTYQVSNLTERHWVSEDSPSSETAIWNNGDPFSPIDHNWSKNTGSFSNNAAYSISNLTLNKPPKDQADLFDDIVAYNKSSSLIAFNTENEISNTENLDGITDEQPLSIHLPNIAKAALDLTIDPDLLIHYNFDNLIEGVTDSSPNEYNGQLISLTASDTTDGPNGYNNALDLSQHQGYVKTPLIEGEFRTICFWFKPDTTITQNTSQVLINIGNNTKSGFIWQGSSVKAIERETITIGRYGSTATNIEISPEWHHFTFSWNDFTQQYDIFIDGALQKINHNYPAELISSEILEIGARSVTNAYSNDAIDEIKIFSRSLSGSEIGKYLGLPSYTVTFNLDGKGTTEDPLNQNVYQGNSAFPPLVKANEGLRLIGWDADFSSISSDLTLTAIYGPQTQSYLKWDFNDGNILDSSGNNRHGTATKTPEIVPGYIGEAMNFSLSNYATYNLPSELNLPLYSVSLWVKSRTFNQANYTAVFNNNSEADDFQIDIYNDKYRFLGINSQADFTNVTKEWTHLAAVCDGRNIALYCNGTFVIEIDATGSDFGQIQIGTNRANNYFFNGIIDEVTVIEGMLTQEEVSSLAGLPPSHTVTFDLDGKGSSSDSLEQDIDYGQAATAPAITADEGWRFTGWDTDFSNITSDLTVTAQYEETTHDDTFPRYRLYNQNDGNHHWTTNKDEYDFLVSVGWSGEGFDHRSLLEQLPILKVTSSPYWRLYNPNSGEHHWTVSKDEYDYLGKVGWAQEDRDGYIFAINAGDTIALYRLYNPNSGLHHYTTDSAEYAMLVGVGWADEGISAWVFSKE